METLTTFFPFSSEKENKGTKEKEKKGGKYTST